MHVRRAPEEELEWIGRESRALRQVAELLPFHKSKPGESAEDENRVALALSPPSTFKLAASLLHRNALLQEPRVLKEQVPAMYDMASWDLFVSGRNAREKQWREEKQSERESRRAAEKIAKCSSWPTWLARWGDAQKTIE